MYPCLHLEWLIGIVTTVVAAIHICRGGDQPKVALVKRASRHLEG